MNNKILGVAIASFVVIILGLTFISSLGQQNYLISTLDSVSTIPANLTNSTCTKVASGCINSITALTNTTKTYSVTNATICRTSTGNTDGLRIVGNTGYASTEANVSYTISPTCSYVDNSTSRTLFSVVLIMFAFAILAAGLYYVYKSGIIDWF